MKNVSEIATREWYIPESDYWQTVGFGNPTECTLWVTDMKFRFKENKDRFRTRVFVVTNGSLVKFLEKNDLHGC